MHENVTKHTRMAENARLGATLPGFPDCQMAVLLECQSDRLSQNVPKCTQMHQNVSRIYQNVRECTKNATECARMFKLQQNV